MPSGIVLHAPTSSTQKLKLMGRGGQFTYISTQITLQSLTGIKGLSEAKVDKICEAAEKLLVRSFEFSLPKTSMQSGLYDMVS